MILVIPVCHKDLSLALLQAQRIKELGGVSTRKVVVVASPGVLEQVDTLLSVLRESFQEVDCHGAFPIRERGWPQACNDMFARTCFYLLRIRNTEPWYLMEPDTVPLKAGWFDALEKEWVEARRQGKLFVGCIEPATFMRPDKSRFQDGFYMMGSGIYPPGFPQGSSKLIYYLNQIPWDVYLRNDIFKKTAGTKLIQNNWSTCNYRREGGQIVCDKKHEDGRANPVFEEALVLHGAKDATLYECMRPAYAPAPVPSSPPTIELTETPPPKPKRRRGKPGRMKRGFPK